MEMTQPVPPFGRDVEARAQARAQLRSLAEQGAFPAAELDQRLAELDRVGSSGLATMTALPGYSAQDRLRLVAGMSAERRRGAWTVPPYLFIQAAASNVRLDCREAVTAAVIIDVEISGGMGSVKMILPEGWAVNGDRLTKQIGTASVRVPGTPAPGCPLIVVHGALGVGSFRAVTRRSRRG
jgi:hypothetical protein